MPVEVYQSTNDEQTNATNTSYETLACQYLFSEWPFDVDGKDALTNQRNVSFDSPVVVPGKVSNALQIDSAKNTILDTDVALDISINTDEGSYATAIAPEWSLCGWIKTIPKNTNYNNISYPINTCLAFDCGTGANIDLNVHISCPVSKDYQQLYGDYIVPIVGNKQYFAFFYKDQNSASLGVCLYLPYYLTCGDTVNGDIKVDPYIYKCTPALYFFVFPELQAADFFAGNYWLFTELYYSAGTPASGVANTFWVYLRADYMAPGKGHDASQVVTMPNKNKFVAPATDKDCNNYFPPKVNFKWVFPYPAQTPFNGGTVSTPYVLLDNWSYYTKDIAAILSKDNVHPIGPGYLDLLTSAVRPDVGCKGIFIRKVEYNYRRKRLQTG